MPVEIQQVVVLPRLEGFADLTCSPLHGVHMVQTMQQERRFLASLQTYEVNQSFLSKMPAHGRDQWLHEDDVAQGAESRNQHARSRGLELGRRGHVSKVVLLLSSWRHVFGRHPHPPVSACV